MLWLQETSEGMDPNWWTAFVHRCLVSVRLFFHCLLVSQSCLVNPQMLSTKITQSLQLSQPTDVKHQDNTVLTACWKKEKEDRFQWLAFNIKFFEQLGWAFLLPDRQSSFRKKTHKNHDIGGFFMPFPSCLDSLQSRQKHYKHSFFMWSGRS